MTAKTSTRHHGSGAPQPRHPRQPARHDRCRAAAPAPDADAQPATPAPQPARHDPSGDATLDDAGPAGRKPALSQTHPDADPHDARPTPTQTRTTQTRTTQTRRTQTRQDLTRTTQTPRNRIPGAAAFRAISLRQELTPRCPRPMRPRSAGPRAHDATRAPHLPRPPTQQEQIPRYPQPHAAQVRRGPGPAARRPGRASQTRRRRDPNPDPRLTLTTRSRPGADPDPARRRRRTTQARRDPYRTRPCSTRPRRGRRPPTPTGEAANGGENRRAPCPPC